MFRASQIPSDETLLVLGNAATNALDSKCEPNGDSALKSSNNKQTSPSYGIIGIFPPVRHKYPIAVFFVLIAKFFEAFAANGIRTILALYLRNDLLFSESFSTVMLHIFNFFGQFCPIFGAILADSYLGNIRTISTFCFLYFLGWILLIMTSLPSLGVPIIFLISVSLLFIAIGNGSIRACITSLGALQFKVPEQNRQLAEYFSLYYFAYYIGIFLSKLLPPLVRAQTQCFNKNDCYPAVFGTLASSFLASWITFSIGKFFYKQEKLSSENILIKFYGCVKYALLVKWKKRRDRDETTSKYWLHHSIGRYERSFVNDVAKVMKISKLFLPLPIYFALLAQQDSSWTFQATMMNTTISNITIQPDQAKAMGPIILFILIPLWQYFCHPVLKRCLHWELKPLYSVTVGGVCSALAFVCAGVLQYYIDKNPYKYLNIAWQIPQFFLLMLGELLLSIPGLQFAFTEAPASMKSVLTAAWFLNNAFGNLIVIIVTQLNIFSTQSTEYFFYALFMLVSIILFALLAYDYNLHDYRGSFYANIEPPCTQANGKDTDASALRAKDVPLERTNNMQRHINDNVASTSAAASNRETFSSFR